MSLSQWIADTGENPTFIAAMAHMWFACSVLLASDVVAGRTGTAALVVLTLAAVKEFWFDVRYEDDPPQTYLDGLQDFAGYAAGVVAGLLLAWL